MSGAVVAGVGLGPRFHCPPLPFQIAGVVTVVQCLDLEALEANGAGGTDACQAGDGGDGGGQTRRAAADRASGADERDVEMRTIRQTVCEPDERFDATARFIERAAPRCGVPSVFSDSTVAVRERAVP